MKSSDGKIFTSYESLICSFVVIMRLLAVSVCINLSYGIIDNLALVYIAA